MLLYSVNFVFVSGKYVGWRNNNADCVYLCEKALSLQTCMTQWNRTKPLPSSNSDKQYHNSCLFDLYTIFQLFWCCTILLCEEQTEISAFVFHKRKFETTWQWVNDRIFCFVWTIPLNEDNLSVCEVKILEQVLTGGPVIPIPGSPFSPASPGTPGTPRSPW